MKTAKDLEDLVTRIAEELTICDRVCYDLKSLQYGGILDSCVYGDYFNYIDLSEEAFNAIPENELGGWQREEAIDIRQTLKLPHCVEKPHSSTSFHWMEAFTDEYAKNQSFFREAVSALSNHHPFRNFRFVLDRHGLTQKWYPFRDDCLKEYVREEIDFANSAI